MTDMIVIDSASVFRAFCRKPCYYSYWLLAFNAGNKLNFKICSVNRGSFKVFTFQLRYKNIIPCQEQRCVIVTVMEVVNLTDTLMIEIHIDC